MVSERKRFSGIDQLSFSHDLKNAKSAEDLTCIDSIFETFSKEEAPTIVRPPIPPKPSKLKVNPSLSQPNDPVIRNVVSLSFSDSGSILESPRMSQQRKSAPVASLPTNIEPSKPPMRPPRPLQTVSAPRVNLNVKSDEKRKVGPIQRGGRKTPNSPRRRRLNYVNFAVGEDIDSVKIHDQELSDFASHITKLIKSTSHDKDDFDLDGFTSTLLPAPILTDEHLTLHHSQRLKLFNLMVLTMEPNTEISSVGFDLDLSDKTLPILVEKNRTKNLDKLSPTLINMLLKSNARDLINIFFQTSYPLADKQECADSLLRIAGTQFYLKDMQIPLHRFHYIRYCLRRREAPRFIVEHLPTLFLNSKPIECEAIDEVDPDQQDDYFLDTFTDILRESCPESLYNLLCQIPVVYKTLLGNLELIRESRREGREWMHIGKLKHLEQTIKLMTLQLGRFDSFIIDSSLNQIFKLHSRHKNSGLDFKTKSVISKDLEKLIFELEDQFIMHTHAYSLLTKIPISLGSNISLEELVKTRNYQPGNLEQPRNSNIHVWIGGVHRIHNEQPTRPKLYCLEAVLMCGRNVLMSPTRSSYCRCDPGRFYVYIRCNISLDLGVALNQVPRECYIRITLHSQNESEDCPQTMLKSTGFQPLFTSKGNVNKHYCFLPMAVDCIDYPCDYLKLNYTDPSLTLVEIQLQNIPKDTWDALHLETIQEAAANSFDVSGESDYYLLGSSLNTLASSHSLSVVSSSGSSLYTSGYTEDSSWKSSPSFTRGFSLTNSSELSPHEEKYVTQLIHKDIFQTLSRYDRRLIWSQRLRTSYPHNLTTLSLICQSMPYCDHQARRELSYFLKDWPQERSPGLLQGLYPSIWQTEAREWILDNISKLETETLCLMAPQLIYAVHYEPYHWSPLVELLLKKCQSSLSFAHTLFWILTCCIQLDVNKGNIKTRFQLIRTAILGLLSTEDRDDLLNQENLASYLCDLAVNVKNSREELRRILLKEGLQEIMKKMPSKFTLHVSPAISTTGFKIGRCNYFNSNAVPLRLSFINSDPFGEEIKLMFKKGDDLRQDMLVLQIVKMMDHLWQSYGLDLNVLTFACKPTGKDSGFVELVKECETLREIQTEVGQGLLGSVAVAPLAQWLHRHNPTEDLYKLSVETFTRSCAAWCVASYVLGLCDRHNDNIMLTRQGHVFHIDFGKILGHSQMFGKIKRDRAPFVLTPDMAYVIDGCEHSTVMFQRFIDLCCYAYNILREHMNVLLGLIMLTLPAKMDLPNSIDDVKFVHDQLLPLATNDDATTHFTQLIRESRASISTRLNFFVHSVAQLRSGKSISNTPLLSFIPGNYSRHTEPDLVRVKMKSFQKIYHPEKYYSYVIEVTKQTKNESSKNQFTRSIELSASIDQEGNSREIIFRRFKEFYELNTKLQETYPEAHLPILPTKILIGRSTVKTVAQARFNELKKYVEELLSLPPRFSHCDLIYTFFQATLRDRQDYVSYSTTFPKSPLPEFPEQSKSPKVKLSLSYCKDRTSITMMVMHLRHLTNNNVSQLGSIQLPTTKVKLRMQLKSSAVIKRKTHSVSNSPDPTFNESFVFNIQDSDLSSLSLNISVKEMNLGFIICSAIIQMSDLTLTARPLVRWFEFDAIENNEQTFFK